MWKAAEFRSRAFLEPVGFNMRQSSYYKAFVLLGDYCSHKIISVNFISRLAHYDKFVCKMFKRLDHDVGFDDAEAILQSFSYQWL